MSTTIKRHSIYGLQKNFYWDIRSALADDYRRLNTSTISYNELVASYDGAITIAAFKEWEPIPPPWVIRRQGYLPERTEILQGSERYLGEIRFHFKRFGEEKKGYPSKTYYLSYVFSVDQEQARSYYHEGSLGSSSIFTSPVDFQFEGAYVTTHDYRRLALVKSSEAIDPVIANISITSSKVQEMFENIFPQPDADCTQSLNRLQELGIKYKLDKKILEKLAAAIIVYATYCKREPKSRDACHFEIGKCLIQPTDFNDFCKKKYGLIDLERARYQIGEGEGTYFYHQVSLLGKNIVIDWTARQFPELRQYPYPLIHEIGDGTVSKGWGEIQVLGPHESY